VDESVFTMDAAYRSAMETITAHECTALHPVDQARFFVALDMPPPPTERQRAAFARYDETIADR
jgi:uncharacterized protein (DUF1778 family)